MPISQRDVDICLGASEAAADRAGSMTPPIVQTSLFAHPTFQDLIEGLAAEHEHHVYTRGQNPTIQVVERLLAQLEHAEACKCFASGMGAVSAVLMGLLEAGDHVLFVNHTYGPTLELAAQLERFGVSHDLLLDRDIAVIQQALQPRTRIVWIESPGTMLFRMVDVPAIAALARSRGVLTVMDNTWATPLFQKPLTMGVDLVVHSCSKYIGGHSDVVAGAAMGSAVTLKQIFYRSFLLNGAALAPFDAWLLARGLRTLPERMKRHEATGLAVARFLQRHPAVRRVYHPVLNEERELVNPQLHGYSGLLSFELVRDEFDCVRAVIDRLERFRIGVSWGGVESLVLAPCNGSNYESLEARGIPPGLIRISVGLEGAEVLSADLDQALAAASG